MPADAGDDQHDVGERADRDHDPDVLARQSLPQHVGVLGADRDDQGEAGEQAGDGGVEHPATLGRDGCVKANECFCKNH